MKRNVGTVDRVIRVILGLALLSLAFFGPQSAWGYLGIIPLVTAAIGSCPLYSVLGFASCAVHDNPTSGTP